MHGFIYLFISITKFANVTATPNTKPDDGEVQKNPMVKNDDKETA